MTCCTHQCTEGRDCPNRRPTIDLAEYKESELMAATARTFEQQILDRDQDPDGTWCQAPTLGEFWRAVRPTLPIAAWLAVGIIAAALAVGYITEHHSLVIWQLLQAVS